MNNYDNNFTSNNASLQAQRTLSNASKDTSSNKHRENQIYLSNWNRTFPQITVAVPKKSSQTKTVSYDPAKFAALKQALMKPKTPKSGMEIFAENLANIPEARGFKGGFGEEIYNPYGLILGGLMKGFGQGYSQRKAAEREAADRQDELALRLAQMDYENSKVENLFKKEDEIKTLNQGSTGQGFNYFTVDENGNVKEIQMGDEDAIRAGLGNASGTGKGSAKEAKEQFQTMEGLHNASLFTTSPDFQNANAFAGQFQSNQYDPSDKTQGTLSRWNAYMNRGVDFGVAKSRDISNEARKAEDVLKNKYQWNLDAFKAAEPDLAEKLDESHARATAFEYVKSESLPLIAKYGSLFKPMSDTDIQAVLQGAGLTPEDTAEIRETKLVQAILRGTGISAGGVKTFEDLKNVAANMGIIPMEQGTQSLAQQPVMQNQPAMSSVQPSQSSNLYKPNSGVTYGGTKVEGGYVFD